MCWDCCLRGFRAPVGHAVSAKNSLSLCPSAWCLARTHAGTCCCSVAQRRHGLGSSDDASDEEDDTVTDANGVKRLRISPTWWAEQLQPKYISSTAAAGAAGSSSSSSSARAAYVGSFTRRALCGLLSHCPELWEGSEQVLDQVVHVIKAALSPTGSCADADLEIMHTETAVCKEALGLFQKGLHKEAADKLRSSARSVPGALVLTPECRLRSPFPEAAAVNADGDLDDEF